MKIKMIFSILLMSELLLNGWAVAQQVNIVTNGTVQYDNLQTAINDANSGDTLSITGVFYGPFTIQKSLTVENANSDIPILFGIQKGAGPQSGSRVLFILGSETNPIDVNLIGLDISYGCASVDGLLCENIDALGGNGAGILAQYVNLNLTQCIVENCSASGSGGGLSLLNCNAVIDASQFRINHAATGGAIYCLSSTCAITNQTNIMGSVATADGAAVVCNQSTLTIDNSTISDSVTFTGNGGALYNTDGSTISITNFTEISSNTAEGGEGGGIYNDASSNPATVSTNSKVVDNTPDDIYPPPG